MVINDHIAVATTDCKDFPGVDNCWLIEDVDRERERDDASCLAVVVRDRPWLRRRFDCSSSLEDSTMSLNLADLATRDVSDVIVELKTYDNSLLHERQFP